METITQKRIDSLVKLARHHYRGSKAEDIVANLLLECLEKKTEVRNYMVKNRCIDQIRRDYREAEVLKEISIFIETKTLPVDKEEREGIDLTLAGLSRLERRVLYLRFWEDMPLSDVEKLCPMATHHLRSALGKIKEVLEFEQMLKRGQ